jgi:molybdopterin converting factor small subunit
VTSSPDEIRIDLVLHALLREVAGEDLITLRLSVGATAATALATVVDRHPGLAIHAKTVAFARADMIIRPDAILRDGDRVDALPPVSGG